MQDEATGTPLKTDAATAAASQDFDIDLGIAQENTNQIPAAQQESEFDLNLDLQLPEAKKNDNRLLIEDQKNMPTSEPLPSNEKQGIPMTATETPTAPLIEIQPEIQTPKPILQIEEIKKPTIEEIFTPQENIVPESIPEIPQKIPNEEHPSPPQEENEQEPVIQEEKAMPSTEIKTEETTPKDQEVLKNDMDIIQNLEMTANAGGLANEAIPESVTPTTETKTFDLDAILSTAAPAGEAVQPAIAPEIKNIPPFATPDIQVQTTPTPIQASTLQWTADQPVKQPIMQPKLSKNMRIVVFGSVAIALAGLTAFIIYTMYPDQFGSKVGGDAQMHASELTTGTAIPEQGISGTETTAPTEITSSLEEVGTGNETATGSHESAPIQETFTELNQVLTPEPQPVQNDVSRVTDLVTKGTTFLEEGRKIGNSKLIMYGLYMTKKGTAFLEKIANGEEIDNLSGYFAQSEKYIQQGNDVLGIISPSGTGTTTEETTSSTPPANETPTTAPETGTPQETLPISE